jgi:hypothetical protein
MRRIVVRYKVKPEAAAENERLVKAVFEQLAREKPAGLRYATFKLADGVSFMHVAEVAAEQNPLLALAAFKEFSGSVGQRCVEPPVTTELSLVGAYGAFD